MYDINNLKMNIATESAAASRWYADIDFGFISGTALRMQFFIFCIGIIELHTPVL